MSATSPFPPLIGLLVLLLAAGCGGGEDAPREEAMVPADPGDAFSADSAFAHVLTQLSFGPRIPGTEGHAACAAWIEGRLRAAGGRVTTDSFSWTDGEGRTWPLTNVLGSFGPPGGSRLLFLAHWDTRPWADEDPDPALRDAPVPGANDGASGVAVLLEMARHLGEDLAVGVDLLFVDGEDLGSPGEPDTFCQGSRRFARTHTATYRAAVVLDMVGDREQAFPIEAHSALRAPGVVDWVWQRGARLEPGVFLSEMQGAVVDDHLPLLEVGIPAIDVIDFDYWAWHTVLDDERAVSAESLRRVGRVMLSLALDP
jgi:hypothetical protein